MLDFSIMSRILNDPDLRKLAGELLSKKWRADLNLLQSGTEFTRLLLQEGLQPSTTRTKERLADNLKDLIRVNLDYYSTLIDLNVAFTNRILNTIRDDATAKEPVESQQALTLRLSAHVGEILRAPLRVQNNRHVPTVVGLQMTPFVGVDQSEVVAPPVVFDPPQVSLQPQQEARLFIVIPVTEEFEPGKVYTATVSTVGIQTMHIVVWLQVLEAHSTPVTQSSETVVTPPPSTGTKRAKQAGKSSKVVQKNARKKAE